MLTLQPLPLSHLAATVFVPAVNVTGTVTVDQLFQLDVTGRLSVVVVPFTARSSVSAVVSPLE